LHVIFLNLIDLSHVNLSTGTLSNLRKRNWNT